MLGMKRREWSVFDGSMKDRLMKALRHGWMDDSTDPGTRKATNRLYLLCVEVQSTAADQPLHYLQ